ncbi:uncharacterized protein LOC105763709 [Gossypium raimondii]|uniref:VQ domain-containing protein n=1 Tax=Gossypium raimondii TaxID=29730 RepID=A0A0D2U0T9_GOSRA|nr:uncharacterized protein LOC105763709 [Gossypium raimondii]KJB49175.1 hypothetical protein B456_008G104800 [Gossypium raimondii]MBA0592311.1 hypothetical protein [Gossypium raimondii]
MDSGNSGSVQSPSGGSEEFDSGGNSNSALFNNNPSSHIGHGPLGNQQSPPLLQQQHQSPSSSAVLFDPLSNYFDHPLSSVTNPNSQLNLDVVWSRNLRSEPNCNDLVGGFMASSSPPPTQQLFTNQQAQSRATFPSMQIPQGPESGTKGSGTSGQPNNNNMVRNSKKRSRASRRAPTTVLTTDTTNFRAMVQEFTGIPAPPFTSSPFPRTRLDLFGTTSSPNYLLRPFAQKLNYPPPLFTSSSMVDAIASTPSTNSTSSTTSINYQLPSELGLLKQPQNPLNINMQQNPILNFVSLLQAPPKYPLSNSIDIPSNVSPLKMGAFEGFGLSQGHVNPNLRGVQNMVSSSDGSLPRNENSANPPSWGEAAGSREHDQSLLRSINGRYNNSNTPGLTNGKVNNFSVSSSDFHVDKGPENVATRSEGMVESWICSSD